MLFFCKMVLRPLGLETKKPVSVPGSRSALVAPEGARGDLRTPSEVVEWRVVLTHFMLGSSH